MTMADDGDIPDGHYNLRLYVAGRTANSMEAIANLRRLCDEHLPGRHTVEIIDLSQDPKRAAQDQIVALPTLVRHLPPPLKRIIGKLADVDKVLFGLEIKKLNP
ncbi:circadian clock KaiB family protein [Chenggangzhangella methanolivorans]